ncbi:SDR family oxidoreductase [Winogradskyella forsetii]|uniref:SDR family oxidoreductase n=1 Tax=Winogradskyella forsetii TaxID=2686077 RepID=UPI0015B79A28|nr:SDR family oxidoreductase [Winogradskyella forsetii]
MQKPNERLTNQTSIVTGASSGIGTAVAKALAREGSNVIINYHNNKIGAEEVAHAITQDSKNAGVRIKQADVSDEASVKELFKFGKTEFGTIDICVSNSGIQKDAPLHDMTISQWNQVIGVNLTGQFLCAREALKEFMANGVQEKISSSAGKIIHMSSVHEVIPWSNHANYAAAKGGIVMLMQSICQGYAKYKIRCNSIAPGATKTAINKDVWNNEQSYNDLLRLIPYNRMAEPEDIGAVASWLASDESEYINGTTIFVDGGMTCYPGFTTNG